MKSSDKLNALRNRINRLENENTLLKEKLKSHETFIDHSGLEGVSLREYEVRFKVIFENCSDGIILIDSHGIILDWNNRVETVTGLPREQAVNRYVWDIQFSFVPEDQRKSITVDFLKMAWEKEVFSQPVDHTVTGTGQIITRSGKEEFIEEFVKPFTLGDKRYYMVFQHYLTHEKKT